MANSTAPFVITTQLDMTGIEAGLNKLTARLQGYSPLRGRTRDRTGTGIGIDGKKLKGVNKEMDTLAKKTGKANKQIGKANLLTQQFNQTGHQTKNMLADVGRRVFVWGSAAALIFGALKNLREFYTLTIDVNTALAELKKVLPTATDFEALKGAGFELAIEFGTNPLAVLKILKRFGQSGLDAANSIEATRTALLALNVTGAETEQAFNAIIGANKIFGVAFEDSARIIDKIQAVQANFAVDSKDLIASIQGIGPAITILGGDIDDLFANIAALAEAARVSGKEAANSLKRVFSRLISEEGIRALQQIGIQVHATADSYRPLRAILRDIGTKWDTLTQAERANLAITLAQVRQYSKFAALMGNFEASQRALVISQNAVGDAFRANEHVMATFAKQSEVADNKLKQLAENIIFEGGIAQTLTDLKVGFADFFTAPIGKAVLVGVAIGAVGLAIRGMMSILPAAVVSMNTFGYTMSLAAIQAGNLALGIEILEKSIIRTLPLTTKLTLVFGGLAVLATIAAVAYARITRERRKDTRVMAQAVVEINKLKKAMDALDLRGASEGAGKGFEVLKNTLIELNKELKKGAINLEDVSSSVIKLFTGSGANVTLDELKKITKELETLRDGIQEGLLLPLFSQAREKVDELKKEFGGLVSVIDSGKGGRDALTDFLGEFVDLDLGRFQISGLKSALEEVKALAAASLKGSKQFDTYNESVNSLEKTLARVSQKFDAENKRVQETTTTFEQAINDLIAYDKQMLKIERTVSDVTDREKQLNDILKASNATTKQAASAIISLINPQKIFKKGIDETKKALAEALQINTSTERAEKAQEIFRAVADGLREAAIEIGFTTSQIAELTPLLDQLAEKYNKLHKASTDGINAISISTTAYLSGLKRTTAAVVQGFGAQISAVTEFKRIASGMGAVFDEGGEALRTVDDALLRLRTTLGQNEAQLVTMKTEFNGLKALKETLQSKTDVALFGKDPFGDYNKKMNELVISSTILEKIQEANKEQLKEQVELLLKLRQRALGVVETEKRRVQIIKGQTKLYTAIAQQLIAIAKIQESDSPERVAIKILRTRTKVFQIQLKELDALVNAGKLEKEIAKSKADQLLIDFKIVKVTDAMSAKVERLSKLYGDLKSDADAIGEVFADALGDTDAFFEDLLSKGSLGAFFSRLGRGLSSAIAQTDTRIISEAISKAMKGGATAEIRALEKELQELAQKGSVLGISVKAPIIEAGELAAAAMKAGILTGAAAMQQVINTLPQVVLGVLELLETQKAAKTARITDKAFGTGGFTKAVSRFKGYIEQASADTGVDANLIAAVIRAESAGDPNAVSLDGAQGLMQIMPATGRGLGLKDPFDPKQNIDAGARYLGELLKRYNGNVEKALAAFNAGPGNVDKFGGVPPFKETIDYINRINGHLKSTSDFLTENIPKSLVLVNSPVPLPAPTLAQLEPTGSSQALLDGLNAFPNKFADAIQQSGVTVPRQSLPPMKVTMDESFLLQLSDLTDVLSGLEGQDRLDALVTLYRQGVISDELGRALSLDLQKESDRLQAEIGSQEISQLSTNGRYLAAIAGNTLATADKTDELGNAIPDISATKKLWEAIGRRFASMAATSIGVAIAKAEGRDPADVQRGAGIGSTLGGIIGLATGGPAGFTTGSFIGDLVGSIFGGVFGRDEEKEEEKIQTKTLQEIQANTAQLVDLMSVELINAPVGFNLPVSTGLSGSTSVTVTNTFHIQGNVDTSAIETITQSFDDSLSRSFGGQPTLGE